MARVWIRAVTAVAGVGLAVAVHAGPAEAAPRVRVSTTSIVLADGAAVAVPVRVSCDPGASPNISVEISQRSGRQIANAFGNESNVVCDGTPHDVQVFVTARVLAFSKGVAFVTASVFSCSFFPFPPTPSACTAKSSRTTHLVPGVIQEDSQL